MKKIGLAIFIISFTFFVLLLSLGEYKLTKASLKEGAPKQYETAVQTQAFSKIEGKIYRNQFSFVSEIKKVLRESNYDFVAAQGISDEDISNLIYHSTIDDKVNFSEQGVALSFPEPTKLDSSKRKLIADNLNWLYGKTDLKNKEELGEILNNKKTDINKSVIGKYGFEENKFIKILFKITKKSTTGFVANNQWLLFFLSLIFACIGVLVNVLPDLKKYPGIKNDGIYHNPATNKGWIGIIVGTFLIGLLIMSLKLSAT